MIREASLPSSLKCVGESWGRSRALPLLLLVLLLTAVAWRDLTLLLSQPFAAGLDGYYYVLQVDALLKHGHFYYPNSTPLPFLLLVGLRLLTGDTVLAVKVGVVALHASLCLGLFAIIASTTRSAWPGVVGSALASASQLHLFMVAEFVKNLCAAALLVWCGWFVLRALQTRGSYRLWLPALLALAAAVFSHRSTVFLTAVTGAAIILVRNVTGPEASARRRVAALFAALALWCSPMLVARQTLVAPPAWLANELTGGARWPISEIATIEKTVLLAVCPLTLLIVTAFRGRLGGGPAATVFGSAALLGVLLTLNPFLNYELGWVGISARLSCLAYIELAILVPGLIWMLRLFSRETTVYAATLTLSLLVILNAYAPLPLGIRTSFMAERGRMIQALAASRQRLEPDALVIAPHGDQFAVTYALDIPSQQLWPREEAGRVIYWLLRYVDDQALDASMIVLTTEGGGLHTVMLRDEDLRRRLATMTAAERMRLFVHNLHLQKKYGGDTEFVTRSAKPPPLPRQGPPVPGYGFTKETNVNPPW